MIDRIHLIDEKIPLYFLHGGQSWIDTESSTVTKSKRENVFVDTIEEAGHHVNNQTFIFIFSFSLFLKGLCRCTCRI
jgi:hypothetical protein